MKYQAVLLTGAPASGKSTLAHNLQKRIQPLKVVSFGALLLTLKREGNPDLEYKDLRVLSSGVVSSRDVADLDEVLANNLSTWLEETNVIIDSHAVTHEAYGVRVTTFCRPVLERLHLNAIVVLHCPVKELQRRVKQQSAGRQASTLAQLDRLQQLQASLALVYGVLCGCPVFVVDGKRQPEELADEVARILVDVGKIEESKEQSLSWK